MGSKENNFSEKRHDLSIKFDLQFSYKLRLDAKWMVWILLPLKNSNGIKSVPNTYVWKIPIVALYWGLKTISSARNVTLQFDVMLSFINQKIKTRLFLGGKNCFKTWILYSM